MAARDSLVLYPIEQFDAIGRNVVLEDLREVGHFSIKPGDANTECSVTFDKSGLAVIKPRFRKSVPGLNFDLNNVSAETNFVSARMNLSHCFSRWLEQFQALPAYEQLKSKIDFVFHADDLGFLMRAPYTHRGQAGWTMEVERLDKLLLCKIVRHSSQTETVDHRYEMVSKICHVDIKLLYRNWRFYSMLCDEPEHGETFVSVRYARIAGYGVLFPKYIGATLPKEARAEYVSVMNIRAICLAPALLTAWSAAVLTGMQHIVIGIEGSPDIVTETKIVDVKQLREWAVSENRARGDNRPVWKEECCLGFLRSVLDFISTHSTADDIGTKNAFKFSGNPDGGKPTVDVTN